MKLTDLKVRKLRPGTTPFKVADGHGLMLRVTPTGGKLWRMAYRFAGKQKELAFGAYPSVSLKRARELRDQAKETLALGVDPAAVRKRQHAAREANEQNTFERLGREWFDSQLPRWSSSYSSRLLSRLEADIFPEIGNRPITEIEAPELLKALRAMEARGATEMAKKMLAVSGRIFRYAIAQGSATRDPSQDLRGALRASPPPKRRAALRATELPAFLKALSRYDGEKRTALALQLIVLTFVRTAELRFARWSELEDLDGDRPLWRIPAERMKMRSEHLVPLAPQAVEIFQQLKAERWPASDLVFSAHTRSGAISENTLIYALYRLGYKSRATVHGFRGTASTILNEEGFNSDWIERQLAHVEGNTVRAAYNAAEYLEGRREMMIWWADYLDRALEEGRQQRRAELLKEAEALIG